MSSQCVIWTIPMIDIISPIIGNFGVFPNPMHHAVWMVLHYFVEIFLKSFRVSCLDLVPHGGWTS